MIKLPNEFSKNGLDYKMVKRAEKVVMYEAFSKENGVLVSHEVFDIFTVPGHARQMADGSVVVYEQKEHIPSNEEFGIKFRSKAILDKDLADKYYDLLVKYPNATKTFNDKVKELGL